VGKNELQPCTFASEAGSRRSPSLSAHVDDDARDQEQPGHHRGVVPGNYGGSRCFQNASTTFSRTEWRQLCRA
jgi:hypothetical protein